MPPVLEIEELNDTSFNDVFQALGEVVSEHREATRVQLMELFETLFLSAAFSALPGGDELPDQDVIRAELLLYIHHELPDILTIFDRLQGVEPGV